MEYYRVQDKSHSLYQSIGKVVNSFPSITPDDTILLLEFPNRAREPFRVKSLIPTHISPIDKKAPPRCKYKEYICECGHTLVSDYPVKNPYRCNRCVQREKAKPCPIPLTELAQRYDDGETIQQLAESLHLCNARIREMIIQGGGTIRQIGGNRRSC